VKDAQRHGLRVRHVDVQTSNEVCEIEHEPGGLSLRLGLNYAHGFKAATARQLVEGRRFGLFMGVDDLTRRVPALTRSDLAQLARIGALNSLDGVTHRRDAIWQAEESARMVGPLLQGEGIETRSGYVPLRQMSTEERLVNDYAGTGLTTGPHPMAYNRAALRSAGVSSAIELQRMKDGCRVIAAGAVIARQRPGTALGFIFLSMEDETGISNIVIHPDLYEQDRASVTRGKFLKVYGRLQNQDGVVHVKAEQLEVLAAKFDVRSHDFH